MTDTASESLLARRARTTAELFAATLATSTAAKFVGATEQQLAVFEEVITLILDDATDELGVTVGDQVGDDARGFALATDFLAGWALTAADIPTAILDGDSTALEDIAAQRRELVTTLEAAAAADE